MTPKVDSDVAIIGGGFYGCCIALFLKRYFKKIVLVEKESDIMQRASFINQARVHMGYHYPRNLVTAYRSFINFPRFINDFRKSIIKNFTKLYAIARKGSKVNAHRFYTMFKKMKTPIKEASKDYKSLFNSDLIENVFLVKEYAFDATVLKRVLRERLRKAGVTIRCNEAVRRVKPLKDKTIGLELSQSGKTVTARHVFVCTYSNINKLMIDSGLPLLPLKHEVTEMCLIRVPDRLKTLGVTVMDGPFFSTMPFPSLNVHSLSHVRYTPHYSWIDQNRFVDGNQLLHDKRLNSNYLHMKKDAQRYMPLLKKAEYEKSLFEIKTVLLNNEIDDGRPILFKQDYGGIENLFVVLGGKIDNIYDVLEIFEKGKAPFKLKIFTKG
jgi:glycine/D-amino acid oxidase-like deaminating enzyme